MEYTFTDSFQSDEQIINESTYAFTLDEDTLLGNSQTNRRAVRFQRRELNRPPKCQNAFILYRKDKMASPEFQNKTAEERRACNVSKEIGDLWRREPEHVKSVFRALARKAEQRHSENYAQETGNELEPEEHTIDQAFTEQSQHSFNYIQDNNMQYLFTHPIFILSNPNLNPDGPISFEYYPSAQQAQDYPSWNGGNETAQETHDLIVTAAQQGYYYPSCDGGNETAQETHDLIVTAAQQERYYSSLDGGNETAQETHDLIVTAAQQGCYYSSWDGGDETAQETHDLIVTAAQQGCYYPFGDGDNGTAQETHDLIVTAAQQGCYYPFGDGENGTAQETHDLIVTAAQQGYYCEYYPFMDEGNETAQETHDLIVTAAQQGYYCEYYPFGDEGNETAQETHDLIVTAQQEYYYEY